MPVSTVKVYPGSSYDFTFGGESNVSWFGSGPIFSIVDDPAGAPDGVAGGFAAAFAASRTAYAEYKAASIPAGVSIAAIRMFARFLATGTAGTYDVPVTGFVRPSGVGSGTAGAYFGSGVTITSESQAAEVYHDEQIGSWATDPSTAVAWTLATLASMSWGVRFQAPATDPALNGNLKLDQIYLEVDVVAIAADIDGVRAVGSSFLRLFHRQPELVEITGPALLGDVDNLEMFTLEHPEGPAPGGVGWGTEPWQRGGLIVLERTYDLLAGTVRIVALNARPYLTRWWSTFLTDIGHSLDGQGIPLLHSGGGGITVARASTAYIERPGNPADGLIMAASAGRPKYDRRGLVVEGPGAINAVVASTFSQGSGDTFTSWTKTADGTATVTQSVASILIDEIGLRRSAFAQVGATSASNGYLSQTVAVTGPFRVRARSYNGFGTDRLSLIIRRAADGWDWNDATAAFEAPTVRNKVGLDAGGWRDWHSKLIDPGGADNITLHFGYFSQSGQAGFFALLAAVELVEGATHIGSDLPTTTAASAARVADLVTIENNEIGRMWPVDSGSFNLTVTPFWHGDDLASEEEKVFWHVLHDPENGDSDEILYKAAGTTNRVIFRRDQVEAHVDFTPERDVPFKISVRWVATGGELGLPDFTFQVAVNDVWGADAVLAGLPVMEPTNQVDVGSNGDDSFADGALSYCDVSPLVLYDEELQRRP